MKVGNLGEIEAVAFDIDGTLYAQWQIHFRAIFHYITRPFFFLKYGLVRKEMHGLKPLDNFVEVQAEKMAEKLHCTTEESLSLLDKNVYTGLSKYFTKIPCLPDVPETFQKFKEAGLKIALLSDFPPEQKGEIWGIKKYCDVILGTEALGALKPDPYSFLKMAEALEVPPEKILFVGNSKKYDLAGSKNAGMKCAFFTQNKFVRKVKGADFCFSKYRQLQDFVLKCNIKDN
ncbi:MAG: HAD family hydrolase [Spirochaetia bacterium]|nr:HAD family hydrolase [Spirochaetia bacterium]MCI5609421.1 HAD family hydrolase [Spirochaetia bacterium]